MRRIVLTLALIQIISDKRTIVHSQLVAHRVARMNRLEVVVPPVPIRFTPFGALPWELPISFFTTFCGAHHD
jgi:hypothetical protein